MSKPKTSSPAEDLLAALRPLTVPIDQLTDAELDARLEATRDVHLRAVKVGLLRMREATLASMKAESEND
jgi:hypothetical protein